MCYIHIAMSVYMAEKAGILLDSLSHLVLNLYTNVLLILFSKMTVFFSSHMNNKTLS